MGMRSESKLATAILAVAFVFLATDGVFACQRNGPFEFDELLVADAVVVATAVGYVGTPDLTFTTTGVPTVEVEFRVDEVLAGKVDGPLVLKGYISTRDDYNEMPVPYGFVRKHGRSGACFANTYKKDGKFLLFLKKGKSGYTTNISALGPSNEQITGNEDDWLKWVRNELGRRGRK